MNADALLTEINLKRRYETPPPTPVKKSRRINTRSSIEVKFIKDLCIFCQNKKGNERVHNIQKDLKDKWLKEAFIQRPDELYVYHIRSMVNGAVDSTAGGLKYHQSCWNHIIGRGSQVTPQSTQRLLEHPRIDSLEPSNEDLGGDEMGRYIALSDVMDHLVDLIEDSLSDNRIPNIREIIDRYHQQLRTYEQSDTREYKVIRKWVKRIVESHIPDVKFTQSVPNQPSRITIPDMEATILMLAEKTSR